MSYFKCECGSTLFFQLLPEVFDVNSVRVYGAGSMIKPDHTSITLLSCVTCGIITIPSTSLLGKNALDRDVQVYKDLIEVVNKHNDRVKDNITTNILNTATIEQLEGKFSKMEQEIEVLKSLCSDLDPEVINPSIPTEPLKEEVKPDVKTSKRSKKNT